MFHYGPVLVGSISAPITKNQIQTCNFKMNASEMKTFLNVILLLIGNLIDGNDPVYKFLIIFIRITDIITKDDFDDCTIKILKDLISKHNELYVELFQDTLKPKHHFMVHYTTVIEQLGPLKHLWTFRFESKHQISKHQSHVSSSRVNLPYSLAIKHSLQFSNNLIQQNFFQKDACNFKSISESDLSQYDFYKNLTTVLLRGFKVKSVTYKGALFEQNFYVKCENDIIMKILLIFYETQNNLFLVVQEMNTVFLEKFQAHKIINAYSSFHIKNIELFRYPRQELILNSSCEKVVRF